MAAPRTDFGSWFASTQGDVGGSIAKPAAAPIAASTAPVPASGGLFGMFAAPAPAPPVNDVESGQSETSSFLAAASRGIGSLLGQAQAPPPVDDWTCGLTTLQRYQIALMLGGGAAVLFFLAIFLFLPSAF